MSDSAFRPTPASEREPEVKCRLRVQKYERDGQCSIFVNGHYLPDATVAFIEGRLVLSLKHFEYHSDRWTPDEVVEAKP